MIVAIVGGSGGIGAALVRALVATDDVTRIYATYHRSSAAQSIISDSKIQWAKLDATDESAVCDWVKNLGSIDWLINCVGLLHNDSISPEKSIRQFDPASFTQAMQVNCVPSLLLGKYAGSALKASPQGLFATVSARVGSIEDNRLGGWHSYRASKAALNMALKCLAIEWQRTLPSVRVLSLHPGTTDTNLSKPFQQRVPESKLFSADQTAKYLLKLCREAHSHDSGRFIAWDGSTIPW